LSEQELLEIITGTLTDLRKWEFFPNDRNEAIKLSAEFSNAGNRTETFVLDWWYESLTPDGGINKSGWKMYAGQQKAEKITLDMIQKCQKLTCENLTGLLKQNSKVSGSFGFDPAASRNALDVGYSPNDLNLPVMTNPFAQLLAMFGTQNFFPTRIKPSGRIDSSRGWIRENGKYYFDYSLWLFPVPINLARGLANCPPNFHVDKIITFRSPRASRDKYSNLTLAYPIKK
jgi:CRISPR-associated protein Csb3